VACTAGGDVEWRWRGGKLIYAWKQRWWSCGGCRDLVKQEWFIEEVYGEENDRESWDCE